MKAGRAIRRFVRGSVELGGAWEKFRARTLAWLKAKYGVDRLKCVVEHVDERNRHLHFWVIPRPEELFTAIHQGLLALSQVGKRSRKALRDSAFVKAMSAYQDEFFTGVAGFFGLKRISVNGRRVSGQDLERIRDRAAEVKAAEDRGRLEGKNEATETIAELERRIVLLTASVSRLSAQPLPVVATAAALPVAVEKTFTQPPVGSESRTGEAQSVAQPYSQIDSKRRLQMTDDEFREALQADVDLKLRQSSMRTLPLGVVRVEVSPRKPRPA